MKILEFDKASFRDPAGHVFFHGNEIYRTLSPEASQKMQKLLEQSFFKELMRAGKVIPTTFLSSSKADAETSKDIFPTEHILWHEKIPFLTYPFEWTFSMLKESALLTLDLMETLLNHDFILKDGSAWNVCFYKGSPCFYDVLSIDTYQEGQPWDGFSQFLQEFLYPLMIQAYAGIDFQALWKSTQQGIPADILYKVLPKTSFFKKGVFKYVYLQKKFASNKMIAESTLKNEFSAHAFPKEALLRLINDLKKCIESLHVEEDQSVWKNYTSQNSYKDVDTKEKEKFIEEGLKSLNPSVVIDLGCNTGHYSAIASKNAEVIACDLDPVCIDHIYNQKKTNILPVVLNLMTPSPSMGWQLSERKDIFTRLKADTFLSLALLHHLCITHNVPLDRFVEFLQTVAPQGIVEWVDKSDPMVQFLLGNRKDIFTDYTWDNFKNCIEDCFIIEKTMELNNGTRRLLLLSKRK